MHKKAIEFERSDERGRLIQLVTNKFKQLNILEMTNREPWGNHYHKNRHEFFHVLDGKINVRISKKGCAVETEFQKGESFMVEPYDTHTITNLVDFSRLLLGYSKAFDKENPDLHKEEDLKR